MAKNGDAFFRHFHHNGKNGEKIDGKMAKMAKINGESGNFFSRHFRYFAMAKIEKKKMANGNEPPNIYDKYYYSLHALLFHFT